MRHAHPEVACSCRCANLNDGVGRVVPRVGDYVAVRIEKATHGTLHGTAIARTLLKEVHAKEMWFS